MYVDCSSCGSVMRRAPYVCACVCMYVCIPQVQETICKYVFVYLCHYIQVLYVIMCSDFIFGTD
jgi:hypothetical protein